ncbi:hypothetical protein LEL_07226 [Akanthomyces lecanii RCEF 1005]|uniref:Uncharacterized protein n=1 Tax=Akanthomyces lecanii RCEF 1005 TaxID=1081108 RepID=A0A162KI31_CORDF|nr:hypothetical protein LEL_07226 [Akanthomyces lecanii RCEF 1005]
MVSVAAPLSIIIESKTSSTGSWDGNRMHPSPLASHPFRISTPSFTDLDIPTELQYTSRPQSGLNIAGTRTSYLGGDLHEPIRYGENVRRRRSRDDVAALIEFLRTHEPPPDNFMSQPYSADEEERGRWEKLKVMGKRRSKSMSRALAPMRLPDSAVAGVTTGGHRHIAISIPLDASHFGDTPKCQYPVPHKDARPPVPPLPESVRTFKNEKGVVTVLRPLSPIQHSSNGPASPASPRRFDRDYPPQLLRNRRIIPPSPPPPSPANPEQWPLVHGESEASSNVQQPAASYDANEEGRSKTASRQTSEFVRAAYPTRGSSMTASPRTKHNHASSIDEVIAEEEPYSRNPSPMPREGMMRRNTERRVGHPPVSLATSPTARKSTSNLRSEWQGDREATARQPRVTQVTESPVIPRNESPSPPASIISVKSRREKVRDKKLRDLAAARSSKVVSKPSPTTAMDTEQATQSLTKEQSAPTANAQSGPKLSTIMVVVDMKPDGEAADQEPPITADDTEPVTEVLPEAAASKLPTPPTSTETSPAQKHGFDTRTSLTRRREWQTSREQERKRREAKAHLRQLAASGAHGGRAMTDPERDSLPLYEAYREQRLRDIESRVRRLERSGDVWLRALIPMLEDVNNSSSAVTQSRRLGANDDESIRDWASDDETTTTAADRLGRASQRRKLIRRASLSRERMLEELMRREERDMLDSSYDEMQQPHDVSGMGSIEPLMRELASSGQATQDRRTTTPKVRFQTTAPRKQPEEDDDVPPVPLRPRPASSSRRI